MFLDWLALPCIWIHFWTGFLVFFPSQSVRKPLQSWGVTHCVPQIWGNHQLDFSRLLFIFHLNGNLNSCTTTDCLKFGEMLDWICLGLKPYFFLGHTILSSFHHPSYSNWERKYFSLWVASYFCPIVLNCNIVSVHSLYEFHCCCNNLAHFMALIEHSHWPSPHNSSEVILLSDWPSPE